MTIQNSLRGIDPSKIEEIKEKIIYFQEIHDTLKHYLPTIENQVQILGQELPKLKLLKDWYTSEEWMNAYDLDGEGVFTHTKRGVLSQDEVSNLLEYYLELANDLSVLANEIKSTLVEENY